jgi:hypothetical protein
MHPRYFACSQQMLFLASLFCSCRRHPDRFLGKIAFLLYNRLEEARSWLFRRSIVLERSAQGGGESDFLRL